LVNVVESFTEPTDTGVRSADPPAEPRRAGTAASGGRQAGDWTFARRPFWLFSHIFALAVIVLFANLGLWQLGRHDDRQTANALTEQRRAEEPLTVDERADVTGPDATDLADVPAVVEGVYVDADFVRVVNRSQGGVAGEYVVAIVELADGSKIAVNRGFVPVNADVELASVPAGATELRGWLQDSVAKGRFGADDTGQGSKIPRFNTDDLARRLGEALPPLWLQVEADDGGDFPDPVPLPPLDAGPHFSYAAQWFVFATLGALFYGALLRRQSRTGTRADPGPGATDA
jgi:cytochrome oxidase assembly protein ShyY1